jgi:hypothetical protein
VLPVGGAHPDADRVAEESDAVRGCSVTRRHGAVRGASRVCRMDCAATQVRKYYSRREA